MNLITVDNSNYQVTEEQLAFVEAQLEGPEPALLFMHIPMYIPSLAGDVQHRWKAPIMMDSQGWTSALHSHWKTRPSDPATVSFVELLREGAAADSLAGIFCGHVHFAHQDEFRPSRYQYISHPGLEGGYRIIRLTSI